MEWGDGGEPEFPLLPFYILAKGGFVWKKKK